MVGLTTIRLIGSSVALAALATPLSVFALQERAVTPGEARASEIRIAGDVVTLPIVMVGEFPFVEASVGDVRGRLMLDTGIEGALTLNAHRVPTVGGEVLDARFSGSGQAFPAKLIPEVGPITIASLRFQRATSVESQDARQLEGITPDFIGWLGYRAFAHRAVKLDYRRSRVTFYSGNGASFLQGERVVGKLPFATRRLPNHPVLPGRIGKTKVITTWDTGQNGALFIDGAGKARMLKEGVLVASSSRPGTYDLRGLRLRGRVMPTLRAIDVEPPPSRGGAAIGIVEPIQLSIGYSLLRHFKSVWDFRDGTIYLLES